VSPELAEQRCIESGSPGGDALISGITAAIDVPESIRGIRNFLPPANFFANIPLDVLNNLAVTPRQTSSTHRKSWEESFDFQ
jgi:hypothetical protein